MSIGEDHRQRSCARREEPAPVPFTHIDGDEVNFCVTVLSRLGCGHVNNLAGPTLDHDVSANMENLSEAQRRQIGRGSIRYIHPFFLRAEHCIG